MKEKTNKIYLWRNDTISISETGIDSAVNSAEFIDLDKYSVFRCNSDSI